MRVKKGGDSYGLREIDHAISTTTHYSTYYFDSVYIKVTELLTIYKEILNPNCIYP